MAYHRQTWRSNETALSAANMNNIEDGIEEAKADASDAMDEAEAANALARELADQFLDRVYPVGAIYMSASSTSPATLFGGTWEQIKDTFLLSCGDTYASGATGGEATVQLTVNEMPTHTHVQNAHKHTQDAHNHYAGGASGRYVPYATGSNRMFGAVSKGSYQWSPGVASSNTWAWGTGTDSRTPNIANTTATNQNTGGNGAHNNMPPYLAVYVWKRTA